MRHSALLEARLPWSCLRGTKGILWLARSVGRLNCRSPRNRVMLAFTSALIKTTSPACVPLPIVEPGTVYERVAGLQERVSAQIQIHRSSGEFGPGIHGEWGS